MRRKLEALCERLEYEFPYVMFPHNFLMNSVNVSHVI
jgi:hypothetical protein